MTAAVSLTTNCAGNAKNEENKAGEGAQTDIAESKVTFFVLPVYTQGTTANSIDRDTYGN